MKVFLKYISRNEGELFGTADYYIEIPVSRIYAGFGVAGVIGFLLGVVVCGLI